MLRIKCETKTSYYSEKDLVKPLDSLALLSIFISRRSYLNKHLRVCFLPYGLFAICYLRFTFRRVKSSGLGF